MINRFRRSIFAITALTLFVALAWLLVRPSGSLDFAAPTNNGPRIPNAVPTIATNTSNEFIENTVAAGPAAPRSRDASRQRYPLFDSTSAPKDAPGRNDSPGRNNAPGRNALPRDATTDRLFTPDRDPTSPGAFSPSPSKKPSTVNSADRPKADPYSRIVAASLETQPQMTEPLPDTNETAFVPPGRRYDLQAEPKSFGSNSTLPNFVEFPNQANPNQPNPKPTRMASAAKSKATRPTSPPPVNEPAANSNTASPPPKTKATQPPATQNKISTTEFRLAGQPKLGDHYKDETPTIDGRAWETSASAVDFSPDPIDPSAPYDPYSQMDVYEGKTLNANQRPLLEIGKPWYQLGQLPENQFWLGFHNPVSPQLLLFGDSRWAAASNRVNGDSTTQLAAEMNLFFNLQLTGTERFHMFVGPFDNGVKNHRYLLDDDRLDDELDFDVDFGYFEGDLGAIVGGMVGETLPFDLPFAVGVMPLLVQNGIWMEDAFLGVAATIPARNSARFDISNMDITFFAGFDEIISPAFEFEDDAAKMVGVMGFFEANNGYWEIDYAYLEDRTFRDRSYHNIGIAFTRRFGRLLSNSTRVIINAGQSTNVGPNTADGVLLLSENSLITSAPSTVVPYFNLFAGFDSPQSAARNAAAGGILRNTGILFESDGMTDYPTLDASGNNTYGLAAGLNLMPNDFSQQLVVEAAMLGVMGDQANRVAAGDQYGLGVRYQLPLNNAMILRVDGMVGFLRNDEDINGVRMELRHKF